MRPMRFTPPSRGAGAGTRRSRSSFRVACSPPRAAPPKPPRRLTGGAPACRRPGLAAPRARDRAAGVRLAMLSNAAVVHTARWVEYFRRRGHEVRLWSLEHGPDALGAERLPRLPLPGVLR